MIIVPVRSCMFRILSSISGRLTASHHSVRWSEIKHSILVIFSTIRRGFPFQLRRTMYTISTLGYDLIMASNQTHPHRTISSLWSCLHGKNTSGRNGVITGDSHILNRWSILDILIRNVHIHDRIYTFDDQTRIET